METAQKQITVEIGVIEYEFTAIFHYIPGYWDVDPTERVDDELVKTEVLSPIKGYNSETEQSFTVDSDDEFNMVMDWVSWEDEFNSIEA